MTKTKRLSFGLMLAAIFIFICSRTADPEPLPVPRVVRVLWDYDPIDGFQYRDALEFATDILGPWTEVPGPYELIEDSKTYQVKINIDDAPQKFFRVARTMGTPLL